MNVLDFANYTPVPTPDQVRGWLAKGYTKAIIGTSFGDVWQRQIQVCEANGMDVAEFQFPEALHRTEREWWLDCETPTATKDAVRAICKGNSGLTLPAGIYTGGWWWVPNMQNWNIVAEFPWLKLWDASYGSPPPPFTPYGGWHTRHIHQWQGSIYFGGLNVDLDIEEEEMGMTPEEKKQFDAVAAAVFDIQRQTNEIKATVLSLQSIALDHGKRLNALEAAGK